MADSPTSAAQEHDPQDPADRAEPTGTAAAGPREGRTLASLYLEVAARQRAQRQAQAKASGLVLDEPSWIRAARSGAIGRNSSILGAFKDRPGGIAALAMGLPRSHPSMLDLALPSASTTAQKILGVTAGEGSAKILQSWARSGKLPTLGLLGVSGLPDSVLRSSGVVSIVRARVGVPDVMPWVKVSLWGGRPGSVFDGFAFSASTAGLFKAAFGGLLDSWRQLADLLADSWPEATRRAWAALKAASSRLRAPRTTQERS